jgi:hypothetical protein
MQNFDWYSLFVQISKLALFSVFFVLISLINPFRVNSINVHRTESYAVPVRADHVMSSPITAGLSVAGFPFEMHSKNVSLASVDSEEFRISEPTIFFQSPVGRFTLHSDAAYFGNSDRVNFFGGVRIYNSNELDKFEGDVINNCLNMDFKKCLPESHLRFHTTYIESDKLTVDFNDRTAPLLRFSGGVTAVYYPNMNAAFNDQ